MSAIFRKSSSGIEACVTHDGSPVLVSRSFRMVDGFRVDIAHWIDPANMLCWFALRNPCIPMLDNSEDEEFFGYNSDSDNDRESKLVRYEGVILMLVSDLRDDQRPYLLDLKGRILAGSNVYGSGHYCLGDAFNPLSLQPVEMLLHNEANDDLGWRGHYLSGTWLENHFLCTEWPTLNHHQSPPAAILADIARWWPT